ncbi:MAG: hypothetical protein N2A40_02035 [Desulfobulbaceae bacterium]
MQLFRQKILNGLFSRIVSDDDNYTDIEEARKILLMFGLSSVGISLCCFPLEPSAGTVGSFCWQCSIILLL